MRNFKTTISIFNVEYLCNYSKPSLKRRVCSSIKHIKLSPPLNSTEHKYVFQFKLLSTRAVVSCGFKNQIVKLQNDVARVFV